MKKLMVLALISLATSSAYAGARVVDCTTPGDALGGLRIWFATTSIVRVQESTMEGKKLTYQAATTPADWALFNQGRDVSFVWYPANAPMFGGAITKATILTLHTRNGATSKGYLTRGGTVFFLSCTN